MTRPLTGVDIFLSAYNTLGNIINKINKNSEVKKSLETSEELRGAIQAYRELELDLRETIKTHQQLRARLSALIKENMDDEDRDEKIVERHKIIRIKEKETQPSKYDKYKTLKKKGANPNEVYLAIQTDRIQDPIEQIRILRAVFDFSVMEARKIITMNDRNR